MRRRREIDNTSIQITVHFIVKTACLEHEQPVCQCSGLSQSAYYRSLDYTALNWMSRLRGCPI